MSFERHTGSKINNIFLEFQAPQMKIMWQYKDHEIRPFRELSGPGKVNSLNFNNLPNKRPSSI